MSRRHKAPWWLIGLLLVLVLLNVYDILETLRFSPLYSAVQVPFPPGSRLMLATFWVVVLAMVTLGLLRHRRWAFAWVAPILTLYGIAGLVWAVLFVQADYGRGRLGFQALLAIIMLLPIWWLVIRRGWLKPVTTPSP